jgi:predicted transposase/invertase (TIGR01784 family)
MSQNQDKNHDSAYKHLFSNPEMIESLIKDFVPEKWVNDVDFSTLELCNTNFTTDDLRQRHDDIIWRLRWKNSWIYVYLLVEFQRTIDPWMALRIMVYTGLLYQDIIKAQKLTLKDKLPPVFPFVLYNGLRKWNAPKEVSKLIMPMPPGLKSYRPSQKYFLLDESSFSQDKLNSQTGLASELIKMERTRNTEELREVVRVLIEKLKGPEYLSLRRAFCVWIRNVLLAKLIPGESIPEVEELEEVDNMLAERVDQWTKQWKMEGLEEGRQQGLQQGMQQGIQQGVKVGQNSLLKKLLRKRFGITLDPRLQERLGNASSEELDLWAERIFDAKTIDEVFREDRDGRCDS